MAEMILKLLLALAAGALIGAERERRDRSAGVRTHMLVCVGSALFTLASIRMAANADPTRIAAQIVTGIGFLGAGTIFRAGDTVRGLTTAAGIWVVAGIGMGIAAGGELAGVAGITAALVFAVNRWVRILEDRWLRASWELLLTVPRGHEVVPELVAALPQMGVQVEGMEWLPGSSAGEDALLRLRLHVANPAGRSEVDAWIAGHPAIRRADWA